MTQTDAKQYAQALLRLNPYNSAQQIVEQRARFLGLENQASTEPGTDADLAQRRQTAEAELAKKRARFGGLQNQASTKPGADADLPRRRQTAEAELAKIRSDFWTSPLPEIQSRLATLKFEGMPDLAASARQMARVADVRPEFERIYAEHQINKQFVDALRQILVLPPAAAGQKKYQQEQELRWRKPQSVKYTVRFVKRNYPQIYDLERDWLDHIALASRPARPAKDRAESNYLWLWPIIILLLSMLARLFK
jgi:hypothetical protein